MDLFRTTYLFATYYGFYAVGILVFGTIGLMWVRTLPLVRSNVNRIA